MGGIVVGLLYPLRRSRFGAMVVTALAAMPFYAAIGYAMVGAQKWDRVDSLFVVVIGCVFGLVASRVLRIEGP